MGVPVKTGDGGKRAASLRQIFNLQSIARIHGALPQVADLRGPRRRAKQPAFERVGHIGRACFRGVARPIPMIAGSIPAALFSGGTWAAINPRRDLCFESTSAITTSGIRWQSC